VLGAYTAERLKGATPYAARQAMELAIRASDEYKARRPKGTIVEAMVPRLDAESIGNGRGERAAAPTSIRRPIPGPPP